ncbi:DNA polymerase III subunit delta [Paraperlucidibaca sp.]|jgi:DNA polymerase-3 subunit delta|uniref:DNA polymerase III subunit delta n=1 Tax=Paraperlucidibaca sp. TaxID=2708021 RepID=UPI003989CCC7
MQLRPEQLARHLESPLAALYLINGDEPLLVQEAADGIRAAAIKQGYDERIRHDVDRSFNWSDVLADAQALSLFAQRRLMELRFNNKPDAAATQALCALAAQPPEDTVLLILLPKIDGKAQKAKWYSEVEGAGVGVSLYNIDANELPKWLTARAKSLGLSLPADALQLIVDRTEGNLLAAAQTLEKLKLLHPDTAPSVEDVAAVVSDSARYSVFDLADAVLNGDATRTARLVLGLQAEGVAESIVLWALQKDLRGLTLIAEQMHSSDQRQASSQLLTQQGFWSRRQGPAQNALRRLSLPRLQRMSSGIIDIDRAIKGQSPDRAWDGLLRLAMAMAGRPLFTG